MPNASSTPNLTWRTVISPETKYFALNVKEIWERKFLIYLLIRQYIVVRFKNTIIGPVWVIFQPLFATLVFYVIFNRVAGLHTGDIPSVLFYLSGNVLWLYFTTVFHRSANFFLGNMNLLSKVYIPKFTLLIAISVSEILTFLIQFSVFLGLTIYYIYQGQVHFTPYVLLFPLLFVMNMLLAIALGNIVSYITLKYRDFMTLVVYVVQFIMYLTPIVYPLSVVKDPQKHFLLLLNPLAGILEAFRLGFLGTGHFSWAWMAYYVGIVLLLFAIGLIAMNRSERIYADIL